MCFWGAKKIFFRGGGGSPKKQRGKAPFWGKKKSLFGFGLLGGGVFEKKKRGLPKVCRKKGAVFNFVPDPNFWFLLPGKVVHGLGKWLGHIYGR